MTLYLVAVIIAFSIALGVGIIVIATMLKKVLNERNKDVNRKD
jgi:F0F1-type ATP synthase membrane subunit b/b'